MKGISAGAKGERRTGEASIYAALARLTAPVAFATRGGAARKLFGFALTEKASMLDLRQAASLTASPTRGALYLRHALDEERHAQMFARRADELRRAAGVDHFGEPRADSEALFQRLGEAAFLAFVHRGERRGRQQFEGYRDHFAARGDGKTRALFEALLDDERRHEAYSRALLVELSGGERQARRLLRRSIAWEGLRRWRRAGRSIAHAAYVLLMGALYLTLAPLALFVRVRRPERAGWRPPAGGP